MDFTQRQETNIYYSRDQPFHLREKNLKVRVLDLIIHHKK